MMSISQKVSGGINYLTIIILRLLIRISQEKNKVAYLPSDPYPINYYLYAYVCMHVCVCVKEK